MSAFTERLRLAADRVSRHCFKQPGDSGLMSIPADPERDVDLLLVEAAAEIERLRTSEREGWRYADELEAERVHLLALLEEARPAIYDHACNDALCAQIDAAIAGATDQPSAAPHDNKANVSVRCPDCDDGAYKGTDRICLTCNGLGELRRATFPTPPAPPSACNHFPGQSTCEWCGAVQPERCCLDYPRCDCNSPPEPDSLPCGHPASLLLRSAETGEPLYCELCDDKSGRRDAVQCETELRAEVDRLKAALKTVGDDYPGSSCQQWCYEAAGIRAPTLQPCGHPWKAQHDFKCILCSAPGDATYAQLAEEQRFLHGAAADAVEVERLQRLMQKIMARCADLLDEDQFNELDAMTRATDPTDAAT